MKYLSKSRTFIFLLICSGTLLLGGCPCKEVDHSSCAPAGQKSNRPDIRVAYGELAQFSRTFEYQVNSEGQVIIGGDLSLGNQNQVFKKAGIWLRNLPWPSDENGKVKIPYFFQKGFTSKKMVQDAAVAWKTASNGVIEFYEIPEPTADSGIEAAVKIIAGSGCYSGFLGYAPAIGTVSLGFGCDTSTAIHEMGHVLGFIHEHERPDRDDYIEVLWCNINPDWRDQYEKYYDLDITKGPYDFDSIMHYGSMGSANAGLNPTMRSRVHGRSVPNFSNRSISSYDRLAVLCRYTEDENACQQLGNK